MNRGAKEQALKAMSNNSFYIAQRKAWFIWAAKPNSCSTCSAEPYNPCMNLTERKKGNEQRTKWPHESRVNWSRVVQGLRERGYITD